MRMAQHSNKLETNAQVESQNFGIGDASVVIEILRNRLYSHPIRTLVQEYISNARDAMREVGNTAPYDVTIPTRLNPTFKVRDYGPGITPDRMGSVFVNYGSSTKRNTNNQTGGFGIGAKSAWSYTDSFTIVTFVDGVKRSYVAHTGVNNNGRLDLVATEKTTEPNGTEIQIAVKNMDLNAFTSAIYRAIYFWDVRPNLKGTLDPFTATRGTMLGDGLEVIQAEMLPEYIDPSSNNYAAMAVIDGIPYEIGQTLADKVGISQLREVVRKKAILHFGNGVVEVSASREAIADSKTTVEALSKIVTAATRKAKAHVVAKFKAATTTQDYLKTYHELEADFNTQDFAKYRDYQIGNQRIRSELFAKVKFVKASVFNQHGRRSETKVFKDWMKSDKADELKHQNIGLSSYPHLFYVSIDEPAVQQNKRVREYFKDITQDVDMVLVYPLNGDLKTLDQIKTDLNLRDFSALPLPPVVEKEKKAKIKREDAEICLHTFDTRFTYTTLASNEDEWLYVPVYDGSWSGITHQDAKSLHWYLKETHGIKVCGVADRALKMVQGDKNFTPLKDWLASFKPTDKEVNSVLHDVLKNGELLGIVPKPSDLNDKRLLILQDAHS